jgi:hypothetical protein
VSSADLGGQRRVAPRQAIDGGYPPGTSDDDAPEAAGKRWRQASGDGALEADGRRRRTLGPVATTVTQGVVGVGGHEGRGSLWQSCEAQSSLAMSAMRGVGGSGVLRRPTPLIWWLGRRPLI